MKSPIKIAVVGLGRSGWSIHINQLRYRKDFKIVDVADPDPKRREEAALEFGCGTHVNIDALLKKTSAEIVVAATPSFTHESDTVKILKSGRHCIIEKPMAMSFAGAKRMVAVAKKARRKLFVHQNYRFAEEFLHLREIIDSGIIGNVFEIRTCWFGFARRNDWQTLRKNGGGVLNNTCPHVIDMALNLLDAPVTSLLSDLQHIKDSGDCDDHVHIYMKAKNGRTVDITCSTSCALPSPKWMLLGSCGTLTSDGITSTLKYYNPKAVRKLPVIDSAAAGRKYGNSDVLPWKEEQRPAAPVKIKLPFYKSTSAMNLKGKTLDAFAIAEMRYYNNVADVLLRGAKMFVTPESAAEVMHIIEWARKGTAFPTKV